MFMIGKRSYDESRDHTVGHGPKGLLNVPENNDDYDYLLFTPINM